MKQSIKVKVLMPAFLDHSLLNEDSLLLLDEGATVKNLFDTLKIPLILRPILLVLVDYEPAKLKTVLQDGSTVSFVFPIAGG